MLTYSHFMWDYEPMMYGWREGSMPKVKPPADAKAVWEIEQRRSRTAPGSHPPDDEAGRDDPPPDRLPHQARRAHLRALLAARGTALIAAEELGRTCYAIEQSPQFVDVAVARWEAFTGKQARRE